jgi:SAM-dependent methyltransferase
MIGKVKKFLDYTKSFRKETDSWFSAGKIGFLVAKSPDGLNEREVEWPWVTNQASKLPRKGRLLDVGSYATPLPGWLAQLGYQVSALDINPPQIAEPGFVQIVTGDIRKTAFADNIFDVITCVSTLEHIGVKGRYGVCEEDCSGDAKAMREMRRILRPGGSLLITIPYGRYHVLPVNRCYNKSHTKKLWNGFATVRADFFVFRNGWVSVTEADAARVGWYTQPWYALGCFQLEKWI